MRHRERHRDQIENILGRHVVHRTAQLLEVLELNLLELQVQRLRHVLRQEIPLVFQKDMEFYATAVFAGALTFLLLREYQPPARWHRWAGMAIILLLRLAAMRWKWRLPMFRRRSPRPG